MNHRRAAALVLLPLAAGCATVVPQPGTSGPPPAARAPAGVPATDPAPPRSGFRAPTVMQGPGLDGVIGQNRAALLRQFGPARLVVPEGDALILQWAGPRCVLDIYLYPLREGAEPVATHVEARRASDAEEVDRAACVRALRR
ncbi:hypothetical protein EYB45_02685 [Erythrobacteraceae bacterium CFH 75059]|uniref:hypothetical protein n=1 Tax=Qipengyuania thermophila TaxID=2509361 RepID=UPI00101FCF74|nr:hypothetical protein [Qipengyuania thermophila]TCD06632.1 hypothetical protein EYB45_02685 [Erythrobacteraceae bacterium CFH 75059]